MERLNDNIQINNLILKDNKLLKDQKTSENNFETVAPDILNIINDNFQTTNNLLRENNKLIHYQSNIIIVVLLFVSGKYFRLIK